MSNLLEILGSGLDRGISEVLACHYSTVGARSAGEGSPELSAGIDLLRNEEFSLAVSALTLACRQMPQSVPARLALASACAEQGDIAAAIANLQIANGQTPGNADVAFALGFCCERLGRPQEAAEFYRKLIETDPAAATARQRLAAVSLKLNNVPEAIAQYESLLEQQPEDAGLRTALGCLYYRSGEFAAAIAHFEAAVAMEPANWSLVDDEVESLVADGQLRQAIDRIKYLLEDQGPFADLHLRLADLYSQCGDDEQATRNYQAARELQPNYLEAAVKTGTHHLVFGRWEQAAEAFCEAAELNDALLVNYVGLGAARLAAGNRELALQSFDLASAVEPNSSMLIAEMARLQLKAAVADEMAAAFDGGEKLPSARIELDNHRLLGKQLERHAAEVGRCPTDADLRYRYGVLLRAQANLPAALEQLEQAVNLHPTHLQAIIKLGITQQELTRIDDSIETFRSAMDLDPVAIDLHYRLGLLFTDRRAFEQFATESETKAQRVAIARTENTTFARPNVRAALAISLQNMGLMDRPAATWRALERMNKQRTASLKGKP